MEVGIAEHRQQQATDAAVKNENWLEVEGWEIERRERGELMAIYELILVVHENQREKGIYATTTIVNIFIFISISMEKKERKKIHN